MPSASESSYVEKEYEEAEEFVCRDEGHRNGYGEPFEDELLTVEELREKYRDLIEMSSLVWYDGTKKREDSGGDVGRWDVTPTRIGTRSVRSNKSKRQRRLGKWRLGVSRGMEDENRPKEHVRKSSWISFPFLSGFMSSQDGSGVKEEIGKDDDGDDEASNYENELRLHIGL